MWYAMKCYDEVYRVSYLVYGPKGEGFMSKEIAQAECDRLNRLKRDKP